MFSNPAVYLCDIRRSQNARLLALARGAPAPPKRRGAITTVGAIRSRGAVAPVYWDREDCFREILGLGMSYKPYFGVGVFTVSTAAPPWPLRRLRITLSTSSSSVVAPPVLCVRMHSCMRVSRFALSTEGTCPALSLVYRYTNSIFAWPRAVPVAVGHADSIHPRTIEILQVSHSYRAGTFPLTFLS